MSNDSPLFERATAAAAYIRARSRLEPAIGIVLGSGLGAFAEQIADATTIPFTDIPHFPKSTVPGHSGRLVIGTLDGVPVAVMQGRVHAYEGYSSEEVTFPVRVLGLLGVSAGAAPGGAPAGPAETPSVPLALLPPPPPPPPPAPLLELLLGGALGSGPPPPFG